MKYLRTLAVAFGLAAAPRHSSEAERRYSVDISRLELLSGEIVKVESRRVDCYEQMGDVETATRITDIPCWYTLISVQPTISPSLSMEYDNRVRTVAVNPRRNEGTGIEVITPPLAKGTWVGMKYYPSPNGRVHERDIAAIIFDALGTRASAKEIEADGIVHPLY